MEDDEKNSGLGGVILILWLIGILVMIIGSVFFGWKIDTPCPSYDRTGEIVDDCL